MSILKALTSFTLSLVFIFGLVAAGEMLANSATYGDCRQKGFARMSKTMVIRCEVKR